VLNDEAGDPVPIAAAVAVMAPNRPAPD
jgi:hypothetical protein